MSSAKRKNSWGEDEGSVGHGSRLSEGRDKYERAERGSRLETSCKGDQLERDETSDPFAAKCP